MHEIIKEVERLMHRSVRKQSFRKKNENQRNGSINDYILIYAKIKTKSSIIAVMSLIIVHVQCPQSTIDSVSLR